jgi:hypothetical protein
MVGSTLNYIHDLHDLSKPAEALPPFPFPPRSDYAEVESGAVREVLAIDGETLGYPRLSADDSQLFFLRGTSDADIWLVRFDQK